MIIQSKFKKYDVDFISDLISMESVFNDCEAFYVIDCNVYNLYKKLFVNINKDKLYILDVKEDNKNIYTALEICERITSLPSKRNTKLVSCGGGITQDVTGFVANIIYRGINWTFIPTTLLAACDSCIGGKTSLNYKTYKNLLGTFYPPDRILICSDFFDTLTDKDFNSGLGEIVKFNFMGGNDTLQYIEKNLDNIIKKDKNILNQCISNSLEFKKHYIEEDEFDIGVRINLNFAHTFGHAIEVSSSYNIPHGTAVAMGLIMANKISMDRGILEKNIENRVKNLISSIINIKIDNEWFKHDIIIDAMHKDKKQINNNLTVILMDNKYDLNIVNDISDEEIINSCSYLLYNVIKDY